MDLLAKRYASPFLILDEFIRLQQLHEFVVEIVTIIGEDDRYQKRWDFWVNRVYNMSFEDFIQACENPAPQAQEMTHQEIGNIINDSMKMLEGFNPSL